MYIYVYIWRLQYIYIELFTFYTEGVTQYSYSMCSKEYFTVLQGNVLYKYSVIHLRPHPLDTLTWGVGGGGQGGAGDLLKNKQKWPRWSSEVEMIWITYCEEVSTDRSSRTLSLLRLPTELVKNDGVKFPQHHDDDDDDLKERQVHTWWQDLSEVCGRSDRVFKVDFKPWPFAFHWRTALPLLALHVTVSRCRDLNISVHDYRLLLHYGGGNKDGRECIWTLESTTLTK